MRETHIISGYARPGRYGRFQAECGEMVEGDQHSEQPSCRRCRELQEEDDRSLLALQQMDPREQVTGTRVPRR